MHAKGRVVKYEVSHRYNRRGQHLGDKTRIVVDVPRDIGDEAAALEAADCEMTIDALPADQQGML